ncbi:MAG: hypothetical protein J0I57_13300 [Hyphomicrobium sp.]|nr:hypothetical protein [Hyphomicrobium sp.]MBN9278583.1 hypothetical protein [Hyphomicrobium sp.]
MTIVRKTMTGAALGMSLSLAGCLELTKEATFRENGEARVEMEMALSAELVALATNPAIAKQAGAEGLNLFGDCGKPWPANEPLPAGVRSVESKRGKRGDMETCTIVFDVSDPIAAVESAKKVEVPHADAVPKQDVSLTRLQGAPGYRLKMAMVPAKQPEISAEAAQMAASLMKAMFANRYLTLSLSGQRIENTNGELSADKRKVTWKLPLASLVAPSPDNPTTIEADVIYR